MTSRKRRWDGPKFAPADGGGPRVVIECADGAEASIIARPLERAGFSVALCDGPSRKAGPCPLVDGRGCPAADQADVVVNLLGIGSMQAQEVMATVHRVNPEATFVVRVAPADAQRLTERVEGCDCTLITPHSSLGTIVEAVGASLASHSSCSA